MLRLLLATALAASTPFVPNDPGYQASSAQLEAISVPQAWSLTQGDPGVVIAVIADGVAPDPDLDLVPGNANASGRGRGAVVKEPDDDTYNAGSVVVLHAKPDPHWRFARWQGVYRSRRATCTVRLMQSGVTSAVFKSPGSDPRRGSDPSLSVLEGLSK